MSSEGSHVAPSGESSIELLIAPREAVIGEDLHVRRVLPFRARRRVGPFTFLDEMGPLELKPGADYDVPPHPHIGLSTVTYLLQGEIIHRDSLGSVQRILPGDVNWMTAGRGIAHSERVPDGATARPPGARLHGLQAWVALPLADEECAPAFRHYAHESMPSFSREGVELHLIAGEAYGERSPVATHSRLFYLSARFAPAARLAFDPQGQEAAFYLVSGDVTVDGQVIRAPQLIVFRPGVAFEIAAGAQGAFGMLLGGEPLEGPRFIYWNFVSSSQERIERAKEDWRARRFAEIPGEHGFVPLPE
jgi:redox-sensitive bicupin YhaK (pirin superfamily)